MMSNAVSYGPAESGGARVAGAGGAGADGLLDGLWDPAFGPLGLDVLALGGGEADAAEGGAEMEVLAELIQERGAAAALLPLWGASEASAPALAREFSRLRAEGKTKAEALQGAQLAVMRSGGPGGVRKGRPDLSHPRYWASLVLAGDWT
jgi:hypothetical protein